MHKYLRAIGFSEADTKGKEIALLKMMEQAPPFGGPNREAHETEYAELKCEVGEGMGVILHGYRRADDHSFQREFYYPYMEGLFPVGMEEIYIRRHNDREAFSVLSEEYRMGSALIFYLTNGIEFRERLEEGLRVNAHTFMLTGMSISGKILLPIQKTERQLAKLQESTQNRNRMLEAAREGSEEAMESLTLEDINLYGQISRRMMKEDIYSIVDSCFMPTGIECDNYSVIGEILQLDQIENRWTEENVYRMIVCCNGVHLTVCINEKDLLGEPEIGRRFKGDIWLQGIADFTQCDP